MARGLSQRERALLRRQQHTEGLALTSAPPRVAMAARRAILGSPLWRQAEAPGGPWDLAKRLFDQHRILRWTQGDFSSAAKLARALYVGQLNLTVALLYQDRRVQMRWDSVLELREYLDGALERSVGIHAYRPVVIKSPRGNPLATERENQRWLEPGKSFSEVVRKAREELGELATNTEIHAHLGMPSATYYRYLAKERRGQRIK